MQILMVEDNPHLRSLLAWQLQQAGYGVEATDTLRQAKTLLQQQPSQLLILDADSSQRASLQFCSWAHCHFELLILILSSQASETDIVDGLAAGADDYMAKPLSMQLFGARVASLSRRMQRRIPPTYLQFGDLTIDLVQRRLTIRGGAVELTPQEFSLLLVLVQADGGALSRGELLQRAWPEATDNPRTVDTHVLSLRKKIEVDPRQPMYIQTVRSVGYCFDPTARIPAAGVKSLGQTGSVPPAATRHSAGIPETSTPTPTRRSPSPTEGSPLVSTPHRRPSHATSAKGRSGLMAGSTHSGSSLPPARTQPIRTPSMNATPLRSHQEP
ncbi:MAG: response regulator transcription factor [Synechococcaceae cyanobacterium SM2_3_2]|nr:response regulator transcription factor [Synechococcaceae cyanobacterium SM2_3_2]